MHFVNYLCTAKKHVYQLPFYLADVWLKCYCVNVALRDLLFWSPRAGSLFSA